MLCAIPFCESDAWLALELCKWIRQLGCSNNHDAVLVADAATPWQTCLRIKEEADAAFAKVDIISNERSVKGWIPGSVSLFKTAAQFAAGCPWFWLEPDAIPVKHGWLDELEAAYRACGKPFMGALVQHNRTDWPNPYLEGCAVYPANAWQLMQPVFDDNVTWTRACAGVVVSLAANTPLVHHLWGMRDMPPTFGDTHIPGTNILSLQQIRAGAVIFHRSKDGTLIRQLRKASGLVVVSSEKKFCHGGDIGDLIYGLCAVKAVGGGDLYLVPHAVRQPFTRQNSEAILPLLRLQHYLRHVSFHECPIIPFGSRQKPEFIDHDLNEFRLVQFSRRHEGKWENIAETHLRILGQDLKLANNGPWLQVDVKHAIPDRPVVIHRSPRYHNRNFPWKRVLQKYGRQAVFVGMPFEHQLFVRQVGAVPYHKTPDILELARVIAGSKLFIGNQSAPYAIAEGLKHDAILEWCPGVPDCNFVRSNLVVGRRTDFPLPEVPSA